MRAPHQPEAWDGLRRELARALARRQDQPGAWLYGRVGRAVIVDDYMAEEAWHACWLPAIKLYQALGLASRCGARLVGRLDTGLDLTPSGDAEARWQGFRRQAGSPFVGCVVIHEDERLGPRMRAWCVTVAGPHEMSCIVGRA